MALLPSPLARCEPLWTCFESVLLVGVLLGACIFPVLLCGLWVGYFHAMVANSGTVASLQVHSGAPYSCCACWQLKGICRAVPCYRCASLQVEGIFRAGPVHITGADAHPLRRLGWARATAWLEARSNACLCLVRCLHHGKPAVGCDPCCIVCLPVLHDSRLACVPPLHLSSRVPCKAGD